MPLCSKRRDRMPDKRPGAGFVCPQQHLPAALPIMIAQVGGAALGGIIGGLFGRLELNKVERRKISLYMVLAAILCTIDFYLPVSVVYALVFQPFWPRFVGGMVLSLVSLVANAIVFPLLFFATRRLYERERVQSWSSGY